MSIQTKNSSNFFNLHSQMLKINPKKKTSTHTCLFVVDKHQNIYSILLMHIIHGTSSDFYFCKLQIYLWNSIRDKEQARQMNSQRLKPAAQPKAPNSGRVLSLPPERCVNMNMSKVSRKLEAKSSHFGSAVGITTSRTITFPFSGRLAQQFLRILTKFSSFQACSIHCHQLPF